MFIQKMWQKLPARWREEIVSASHTFFGALIAEIVIQLSQNGGLMPTGKEALWALGVMAFRAGWKALVMWLVTQIKTADNP